MLIYKQMKRLSAWQVMLVAWGGVSVALANGQVMPTGADPDAGQPFTLVEPSNPNTSQAETDNCEAIGEFIQRITGANRFRGNFYDITESGELQQFAIQLEIGQGMSADLSFYVYVDNDPNDGSNVFDQLVAVEDVRVAGTGEPTFYFSGPLGIDPLEVGKRYFVTVGWTDTVVAYARRLGGIPTSFSLGKVIGLGGTNNAPPLPQQLDLQISDIGAYSFKLCIRQQGACCMGSDCTLTFEEDCPQEGFTAPGVSCQDVADAGGCPLPTGACCFGDACLILNRLSCDAKGGTFQGTRTTCDVHCPSGACCFDDGTCSDGFSQGFCSSAGGNYRGDGSMCSDVFPDCGQGACCTFDGCVDNISPTLCSQISGVFQGEGAVCDSLDPFCPGFCCWQVNGIDKCSNNITPSDCQDLPRANFGGYGASCNDDPSPCDSVQTGRCCVGDGRCFITSNEACMGLGDNTDWMQGETCESMPCTPVACCFDNGDACQDMIPFDCRNLGGTPDSNGMKCEDQGFQCPETLQACCFTDGSCSNLLSSDCTDANGVPQGPGTDCSDTTCTNICDGINKIRAKCKNKNNRFKIKAKLKTGLPDTEITLLLDGGNPNTKTTKGNGKAKYKWSNVGVGAHEACVENCNMICDSADCN